MLTEIDYFYKVTKYNISDFFSKFKDFTDNYYSNYIGYYRGISKLDPIATTKLNELINDSSIIEGLFFINKDSLSNDLDFWDLYESFNDCVVKIQTIKNTPKWTRSSYIGSFDKDIQVDYILKQNQSLEDLSSQLGFNDPENDWVNLAIKNDLKEVDYSAEGGNLLKVSFSVNNNINTTSVVDVMIGDALVGKDLLSKLTFLNDDLHYLTPKETIQQASEILLSIQTGSVPEFPRDGIYSNLIGTNIKAFQYPSIFRQIIAIFKKDDTFKEVQILNIQYEQDNVVISLKIVSKLNDIITQNLYMNE